MSVENSEFAKKRESNGQPEPISWPEVLRENEQLKDAVFRSCLECIVIIDCEGRILEFNPAAAHTFGFLSADVLGKRMHELILPAELRERYREGLARYFEGGEEPELGKRIEISALRADGLVFPAELTVTSVGDSSRPVFTVFIRDTTDRKRAEAVLHKTNQTLQTFIHASPLAIVALDLERRVTLWNPAAEKFFGWTESEVIGRLSLIIPEEDLQNHLAFRTLFLSSKALPGISNLETRRLRKDGSIIQVSVSYGSLRDTEGAIVGTIGIMADITDRKQAEEELLRTNQSLAGALAKLHSTTDELSSMTQQLWQASKLATMGELAASVAHELNNPLAIISLRLELLIGQLDDDDPNLQSLLVIEQEVDRMATLVSNLLLFSRRSHQQVSTINIAEELQHSLEFINYHLRSHRIVVVTDFAADLPSIQADTQQLRQVFLNLLTNASDAMDHGGTLIVRAKRHLLDSGANAVMIEFSDSGTGIEPEDLLKVWEPFFTTKPEGKGTGLGLPICRRTIEEHRGTINIESLPGTGTTVQIVLPATEGQPGNA